MDSYFIDSGYFIALEDKDDQNHSKAIIHWNSIKTKSPHLATTSFILNEVATFFNSRGHHAKAVYIGKTLLQSAFVEFIFVD
jgi:uncharacterized protein